MLDSSIDYAEIYSVMRETKKYVEKIVLEILWI